MTHPSSTPGSPGAKAQPPHPDVQRTSGGPPEPPPSPIDLLAHIARSRWPALAPRLRWHYEPRPPRTRKLPGISRDLFSAHDAPGHVRIVFHVPLSDTREFVLNADRACRAANEIARGLTSATTLRRRA